MTEASTNMKPFMAQGILVERWKQYVVRFVLFLFIPPTMAALFELPGRSVIRVIAEGLALAVTMSFLYWWADRKSHTTKNSL
jgi:hypothetical protein